MNHLAHEPSPYLRQHADNPVDWYPWGEEALARARREGRPIIVSIGYSTCHWCHVMARESFEDAEVAAFMNEHFVNIKVDREERPDLDALYMAACEAITGRGGWPLNVFLTPEGKPFYAGTYFPPEPGQRMLSWMQALQFAAYNFYENRRAVEQEAEKILGRMERREHAGPPESADSLFSRQSVESMMDGLRKQFDTVEGGFGKGAKFPNAMALELLVQYAWQFSDEEAGAHALATVNRMIQGGLHDFVGGGFSRYTVDRQWRVPHFEKMLYDNAQIARLLALLYKWTKNPGFREALDRTLAFLEAELRHPDGGFCSALDAESEGEEGRFYTWDYGEITDLLPAEPHWFCAYFNIRPEGNREGRNILYASESVGQFAARHGLGRDEVKAYLDGCRAALAPIRARRPRPRRDEKVLLPWNALACSAYALACGATGETRYLTTAEQLLDFLLRHFKMPGGGLRHLYQQEIPAFLDGYAFLIGAMLEVHAVSQRHELLGQAGDLLEEALLRFRDEQGLLFYYSQEKETILRRKPLQEEDMPSPNAVMASNLLRLGAFLDRRQWQELARAMLLAVGGRLCETPLPYASWGGLLLAEYAGIPEIAIAGPGAMEKAREANAAFLGPCLLMATDTPNDAYPLLAHRWKPGETLIYLCRDYACQSPVRTMEEVVQEMEREK